MTKPASSRFSVKFWRGLSGFELSGRPGARGYLAAYLTLAIPLLIAFCFLTGPFQAPDEQAHYFRAIGISHGELLPVASSTKDSAGGYVESGAEALGLYYSNHERITANEVYRFKLQDLARVNKNGNAGPLTYAPYSNTVIYFPVAHLLPAAAIYLGRCIGASPLSWLYVGRLANALGATAISGLAIAALGELGLFGLVFCLLPSVLFEEASLSADALVIAFSLLFASITIKITHNTELKLIDYIALLASMAFVCVGKLAYISLCILPLAIALSQKRARNEILSLCGLAVITFAIWFFWTLTATKNVFNIRTDVSDVDFHQQLHFVIQHPLAFCKVLIEAVKTDTPQTIKALVGARLGWNDWSLPKFVTLIFLITLFATLVSRVKPSSTAQAPIGVPMRIRALVLACLSVCALSIYALIYLQYNSVASQSIIGVQGRYFIPLLAFAPLLIPRLKFRGFSTYIALPVIGWAAVGNVVVLAAVWARYWQA